MIIRYKLLIDSNISFNPSTLKLFVHKVVNHKNGIKVLFGKKLKLIQISNDSPEHAHITISLVCNKDIERICGFDLLSCADRLDGHVYLNWTRWHEGSDVFFNGLTGKYAKLKYSDKLNLYRTYVVNHEIMHILGFDHPPPNTNFNGRKASVMAQQTINLQGGTSYWFPVLSDKKYFKKYSYSRYNF
jgi:hypothetical protein